MPLHSETPFRFANAKGKNKLRGTNYHPLKPGKRFNSQHKPNGNLNNRLSRKLYALSICMKPTDFYLIFLPKCHRNTSVKAQDIMQTCAHYSTIIKEVAIKNNDVVFKLNRGVILPPGFERCSIIVHEHVELRYPLNQIVVVLNLLLIRPICCSNLIKLSNSVGLFHFPCPVKVFDFKHTNNLIEKYLIRHVRVRDVMDIIFAFLNVRTDARLMSGYTNVSLDDIEKFVTNL